MSEATTRSPDVWWNPDKLQGTKPLTAEGPIAGSPFADFGAALKAADARREERDHATPKDNVFLITFESGGWAVYEFSERRWGKADLPELQVRGLPLGGSIEEPRTWLVDARGKVGRLTRRDNGEYGLVETDRTRPQPGPPDVFVPAWVAEPQVNHAQNVRWSPRVALRPGPDVEELAAALGWIDAHLPAGVTVKPGGSRHSWSPVCATDGVYVHPERMQGISRVPAAGESGSVTRSGVDVSHLWRVVAGTRIRTINTRLWAAGQALPALGGYDGQTLGGVLPTGTHGSVFQRGPLAELVQSVDLVRFDGRPIRIEPASTPLTDPAAFRNARPDWELVQADDEFHAVLIGLGAMGVVHSLVVKARDRFWMKEVRTLTTMPECQTVLKRGNLYHVMDGPPPPSGAGQPDGRRFEGHPERAYHLELLWNPYTDKTVITSRQPLDENAQRRFETDEPEYFADPPVRNLFRALKLDPMDAEFSRPDMMELGTEYLRDLLDDAMEFVVKVIPKSVPKFIDNALDGMPDDSYIQRSYNVFNVGDGANRIPAQSGTISLPIRDDIWLGGIDVIRDTARALAHHERKYETGPISLRFVRGSKILLADPEDVCKFEIIFGGDDERVQALSRDIVKAYYDALYAKYGADVRLHWGQIIPDRTLSEPGRAGHRVRESYPRYDDWKRIRDRYDPRGRGLTPWLRSVLPV